MTDIRPDDVLSVQVDATVVRGTSATVVRALHARAPFDQDASLDGYVSRVFSRLAPFGIREVYAADVHARCAALLTALASLGICEILRVSTGTKAN